MGKIITTEFGTASIIKDEDGTRIDSLEVEPEYRNQGHGRGLLVRAIKEATKITDDGKISIVADSKCEEFENADLVEFYESEGFSVVCCDAQCPILEMEV